MRQTTVSTLVVAAGLLLAAAGQAQDVRPGVNMALHNSLPNWSSGTVSSPHRGHGGMGIYPQPGYPGGGVHHYPAYPVQPGIGIGYQHGDTSVQVQLPVRTEVNINRNVRIYAPPGTTVIYGEGVPVGYPYNAAYNDAYPDHAPQRLLRSSNGLCVDAGEVRPQGGGTVLTTGACHGRIGQQWRWQQGRLAVAGLCLDAMGGGQAGAPVGTFTCSGSIDQQWQWQGGQIRHVGSGLCLDSSDNVLRTQRCGGNAGQYFSW